MKTKFVGCIMFIFSTYLFAQTIPAIFNQNQVTDVRIADRPIIVIDLDHTDWQSVNLPRSFFFGNGTSSDPGLCNWLIQQYRLPVGGAAIVRYHVWESGRRYIYRINIDRKGHNEWDWRVHRRRDS